MKIETVHALPADPIVLEAQETIRRLPCVPHLRLTGVPRRQPEDMADLPAVRRFHRFWKRGWRRGFLPMLAEIDGAKYHRPEVPCTRRHPHRSGSRIAHRMIDDLAPEMRAFGTPSWPLQASQQDKQCLAGNNQNDSAFA